MVDDDIYGNLGAYQRSITTRIRHGIPHAGHVHQHHLSQDVLTKNPRGIESQPGTNLAIEQRIDFRSGIDSTRSRLAQQVLQQDSQGKWKLVHASNIGDGDISHRPVSHGKLLNLGFVFHLILSSGRRCWIA